MASRVVLCVDENQVVRERAYAVLELAGHHTVAASLTYAVILLSYRKFDLLVLSSSLEHFEFNAILGVADGAKMVVFDPAAESGQLIERVTAFGWRPLGAA